MKPHSINFSPLSPQNSSPVHTPKRKVLGEIQNSPLPFLPRFTKSPLENQESPISSRLLNSPKLNSPFLKRSSTKITRIFEERSRFKMENKENECYNSETFLKLDVCEETRDSAFSDSMDSPKGRVLQKSATIKNWSVAKMSSERPGCSYTQKVETVSKKQAIYGHDDEIEELDSDFETLHDLDAEFDCDNFDQCNKYEIISTDSPDIISRGRTSSSRKISSKNFVFGAPIGENEQSTSFNKPNPTATRMLTFEDSFEFTSPEHLKRTSLSVKKSLKFSETPTKNLLRHESCSSISSASPLSSQSSKLRLFPSESTRSMESGFVSEMDEPFLELDEMSNSPKISNFNDLLSGEIKDNCAKEFLLKPPSLHRSISFNPETSRARMSLFTKTEEIRKTFKREPLQELELSSSKRMRANAELPLVNKRVNRPVLQRAFSDNSATIMSALARSASDPDLIGDFSVPFALPIMSGDHSDLKSISCDTLASLLRGEYMDSVTEFQVIDCRYPYEYAGGHITGAKNLYTQEQVLTLINRPLQKPEQAEGRSILLFHCEFSLERGPKLSRFLRSSDRAKNRENYPNLHYPEIYLLHEGYRAFFNKYPELCSPSGYTMMTDPKHKEELSTFRKLCPTSGRRSFKF